VTAPAGKDVDVSVLIAAWRAANVIERAILSALASQGVNMEVIVVDDASPDNTMDVLKALAAREPRLIIDRLPQNAGPSTARNRAIELSSGRFIAVLDADDAMMPDRLSSLVTLAGREQADIVVDNMIETDEDGHRIGRDLFLRSSAFTADCGIDLRTWVAFNQPMKRGDCLGYLKPVIRRDALKRLGVSYDATLRNSEDYYLVADLLAQGAKMTYAARPGYLYTRSSSSTSHRLKPEQTRAWLDAEQRFRQRHGAGRTRPERSALARRRRALRNVNQFVAATDAMKAKRIGAFFSLLASDIRSTGYTLGVFARIALGKVLRRKLV
jgi:succinoglycan biosynthesis protein ExoO